MGLRAGVREAVLERDDYTCRYCAKRPEPLYYWHDGIHRWMFLLHVDHIVPRVQGGGDELDNLVTACRDCNLAKYDQFWIPLDWNA